MAKNEKVDAIEGHRAINLGKLSRGQDPMTALFKNQPPRFKQLRVSSKHQDGDGSKHLEIPL
jgi:hypothetical protein